MNYQLWTDMRDKNQGVLTHDRKKPIYSVLNYPLQTDMKYVNNGVLTHNRYKT